MQEIKLKIVELLQLETELNGFKTPEGEVVFNGLLSTKLQLVAKYWINELADTVSKERKKVDDLRNELIKKYGKEKEGGNLVIELFLDEEKTEKNPDYLAFEKEYNELLQEEKTITYTPIQLKHIETVESSENFAMFFRFVQP